jgi:hypothetical protein
MSAQKAVMLAAFAGFALGLSGAPLQAQTCQDERGMADAMVKDVAGIVDTVKKESQADFVGKFHQKSCLNKLTFAIGAVGDAVGCLEKDTADAAAATEKDAESKLKDRLTQYKTSLKAADDPKAAKDLIGTFDFSAGLVTAAAATK